jgi:hypothetical protein
LIVFSFIFLYGFSGVDNTSASLSIEGGGCRRKWWLTVKRQQCHIGASTRLYVQQPGHGLMATKIKQWKGTLGESSGLREASPYTSDELVRLLAVGSE